MVKGGPQPRAQQGYRAQPGQSPASSILSHFIHIIARDHQHCHVYQGRPPKSLKVYKLIERERYRDFTYEKRLQPKVMFNVPGGKPNSWWADEAKGRKSLKDRKGGPGKPKAAGLLFRGGGATGLDKAVFVAKIFVTVTLYLLLYIYIFIIALLKWRSTLNSNEISFNILTSQFY